MHDLRFCLQISLRAWTRFSIRALGFPSCVAPSFKRLQGGIGLSTDCPSPTPFGLGLGPDLPWADEPSPGILRLSAGRILTCLFAYLYRHSHFPLVHYSLRYSFAPVGTLPYQFIYINSAVSVPCLSPVTFSAQGHLTSELLRTL